MSTPGFASPELWATTRDMSVPEIAMLQSLQNARQEAARDLVSANDRQANPENRAESVETLKRKRDDEASVDKTDLQELMDLHRRLGASSSGESYRDLRAARLTEILQFVAFLKKQEIADDRRASDENRMESDDKLTQEQMTGESSANGDDAMTKKVD